MNDYEIRKKLIENLFKGYGKGNDPERVAIYILALADLSTDILQKAISKTRLEEKFVPAVADIVNAAKSIIGEMDESMRTKEWVEAWAEIDKAMRSTPWGMKPRFSSKEIEIAVNSYGWDSLQRSLEADMPTVRAQIRRMYEDACKRSKEKNINAYLVGRADSNLLSKAKQEAPRGLQSAGDVLKSIGGAG